MARYDVLCEPSWQWVRRFAVLLQHLGVVCLGARRVFVPPHAQGGHVVAGDGGDAAEGEGVQVSEAHAAGLGHALQLEGENLQIVHHPWDAVGHHAEVFGADEHAGGLHEGWQLLHGLAVPVLVHAAVEVVVVEAVEGGLVWVGERGVDVVVLSGDAWVEEVRVLRVAQEEYAGDERVESVAQGDVGLVCGGVEGFLHLTLCIVLRLEAVSLVVEWQ